MSGDDHATPDKAELKRIFAATVSDYDRRAGEFWERTRGHDVAQNVDALLRWVKREAGACILDFGCGPGRDLKVFSDKGHTAIGLDGCVSFVEMARAYSGCEVWRQDFLALDLPKAYFDGVYANATLFHVPRRELPRVLGQIRCSLKPAGVLFASNPRGNDEEGWSGDRYGVWHSVEGWRSFLKDAGFVELETYLRPNDIPVAERRWLASVWRKVP
ncbi:MAG: class I SAM-dependent methyltransferase [Beijerinckiaceae bacterium]|nr:class I SAM-dependent methyltransferase [Beijerinckiaceae bacterium]